MSAEEAKQLYIKYFQDLIKRIIHDEVVINEFSISPGVHEVYSDKQKTMIRIPDYSHVTLVCSMSDRQKYLEVLAKLKDSDV